RAGDLPVDGRRARVHVRGAVADRLGQEAWGRDVQVDLDRLVVPAVRAGDRVVAGGQARPVRGEAVRDGGDDVRPRVAGRGARTRAADMGRGQLLEGVVA